MAIPGPAGGDDKVAALDRSLISIATFRRIGNSADQSSSGIGAIWRGRWSCRQCSMNRKPPVLVRLVQASVPRVRTYETKNPTLVGVGVMERNSSAWRSKVCLLATLAAVGFSLRPV